MDVNDNSFRLVCLSVGIDNLDLNDLNDLNDLDLNDLDLVMVADIHDEDKDTNEKFVEVGHASIDVTNGSATNTKTNNTKTKTKPITKVKTKPKLTKTTKQIYSITELKQYSIVEAKIEIKYENRSYEEVMSILLNRGDIFNRDEDVNEKQSESEGKSETIKVQNQDKNKNKNNHTAITVPVSFETVGHIAHFNLRDIHLPVKYIIGTVVLDKFPNISLVCNKVSTLTSVYRNMDLEIIGDREGREGKQNGIKNKKQNQNNPFIATVKENGITVKLDYSKVYWNSRLSGERERLLGQLLDCSNNKICWNTNYTRTVVVDMCCGVGAFVCLCLRNYFDVLCNDINPECIKWIKENIKLNNYAEELPYDDEDVSYYLTFPYPHYHTTHNNNNDDFTFVDINTVSISNMDASKFIKSITSRLQVTDDTSDDDSAEFAEFAKENKKNNKHFHFYMNLPSVAVSLLRPFVGLFSIPEEFNKQKENSKTGNSKTGNSEYEYENEIENDYDNDCDNQRNVNINKRAKRQNDEDLYITNTTSKTRLETQTLKNKYFMHVHQFSKLTNKEDAKIEIIGLCNDVIRNTDGIIIDSVEGLFLFLFLCLCNFYIFLVD